MTEGTDTLKRDTIPDKAALIRGSSEAGFKGDWDNIFHPEEITKEKRLRGRTARGVLSGEGSKPHGRIPGGGESAIDLLFDDPERVSPELRLDFKEFLQERHHRKTIEGVMFKESEEIGEDVEITTSRLKTEFLAWLNEPKKNEVKRKTRPERKRPRFYELDLDPKECGFNIPDLREIWNNGNTVVTYIFDRSGDHSKDFLVFAGKSAGGKEIRVRAEPGELQRAALDSRQSLGFPGTEKAKGIFWERLKAYKINDKPLAAEHLRISYPIDIGYDEEAVERKIESKRIRRSLRAFNRAWTDEIIETIGVGFDNGIVRDIALKVKRGEKESTIAVPFWAFRAAYGVNRFRGRRNGRSTEGAYFCPWAILAPACDTAQIRDTLSSIQIEGTDLPRGVGIVIARHEAGKEPLSETIGRT